MGKNPISSLPQSFTLARRLISTPLPAAEASPASSGATETAAAAALWEKKDGRPLYRRLSALGAASEGSVTRTMNKWVREGRTVKVDALIKFVKELRKYKRHRHALELMDWMVKTRGMNLSYTNHAICLDLICKVLGIKPAEDYFNSLPDPAKNERTYGALLSCYCSQKMANEANALFEKMKELKISSNTLVHNNLMSLYGKLCQPEKVLAVFQTMKASNIAPDNLSYCIVMNSYSSLDDIEAAERVIQEMEESEVVVQWPAYSTLASIYNSAGLFNKAESALKKLEGLIDGHDREPFHFLLTLYASTGNLDEVKRVWKSLKTIYPKQTNMSYFIMLNSLNKFDDIEGMKECFGEWESALVSYDIKIANLMIGAYLQKDMEREAEVVLEKAKERGSSVDIRTCELFMNHYLKDQQMDRATTWLQVATSKMNGTKWTLDMEKVKEFLKHFEEGKDVEGLENFCRILKKLGSLDSRAYESLIRTYFASGKRQPSLRQQIFNDNIELDPKMYKLLGKVCK